MFIRYKVVNREIAIQNYSITNDSNILLNLECDHAKDPCFVRFSIQELGAILATYLDLITKR